MTVTKTLNPETFPRLTDNYANWHSDKKDFEPRTYSAPIFERDGNIYCYSEACNDFSAGAMLFSDYYGEAQNGIAWIHDCLTQWAKENIDPNAYWEWENPGLLCLAV